MALPAAMMISYRRAGDDDDYGRPGSGHLSQLQFKFDFALFPVTTFQILGFATATFEAGPYRASLFFAAGDSAPCLS
jgi:hypothetical protein